MSDKKTKQVVINVSDADKATITELKKTLNVTDKEFISALLVVLAATDEAVVKSAVETVTIEKQKAKITARIAKLEAEIAKAKGEAEAPTNEIIVEEVVEPAADEVAA
jgi:ketopantoate hydroxymethyltransferase